MSIQNSHRSGQSGRESGIDLTIGDIYEGDRLGALTPSDVEFEALQEGRLLTISEVGDEENGAWMQSSEVMEIQE